MCNFLMGLMPLTSLFQLTYILCNVIVVYDMTSLLSTALVENENDTKKWNKNKKKSWDGEKEKF